MKPEPKRPVAIEDLLRLKRTERPPAGFWTEFDQKLRAKQLAALVEKRPWWHAFPSPLALIARHRIPFGAAAAFAFTVLAVREYRSAAPAAPVPDAGSGSLNAIVAASLPVAASEPAPVIAITASPVASAVEISPIESITVIATSESKAETLPLTLAPLPLVSEGAAPVASPASLTLGRTVLGSDIVAPARLVAASATFEARSAPAVRVVDPLQQMTPPGESRRNARLLAAMASPVSTPAASRGSERAASRISEETLYEQVSRFGARGDRLNVKF
jgi:hypothetical protein